MNIIAFDFSVSKPACTIIIGDHIEFLCWPANIDTTSFTKLMKYGVHVYNRNLNSIGDRDLSQYMEEHINRASVLSRLIVLGIEVIVNHYNVDKEQFTIVNEGFAFGATGNAILELSGYKYILLKELKDAGFTGPYYTYSPISIKKSAGCAHKGSTKQDMIDAFSKQEINHMLVTVLKDHPEELKKKKNYVTCLDDIVDSYWAAITYLNTNKIYMNVGIVLPIRMGQEYIRDYVEYHIKLGFDKIILIDNNETDGPNPMDQLIGLEQFINYEDARGNHDSNRQNKLNTEMYRKYWKEFDWLFFSDDDEYYVLNKDNNIKEYLSRPEFTNAEVIAINWKMMNDSGLVHKDSRPVFERFTEACPVNMFMKFQSIPENNHVKSAVRCDREDIVFIHPHYPIANTRLNTVNGSGKQVPGRSPFQVPDYELIELRHYMYKTVEEFVHNRIGTERYYKNAKYDGVPVDNKKEIKNFFIVNKWSLEKQELIDEYIKENNIC